MPLRVLIIPDKFKGSLTADQAAAAIAHGWSSARPGDTLQLLPMSDGGDGFGAVVGQARQLPARTATTIDAAHRPIQADWWWDSTSRTAIIESALSIGLAQLPRGQFHPFDLDTFGLGKLILAAHKAGAGRFIIGIGGSATNDAGFGMARALNWQFLRKDGSPVQHWTELASLHSVLPPEPNPLQSIRSVEVAVDVQNPLLGPTGATRIYGPQKGLTPDDFPKAEAALTQLVKVLQQEADTGLANLPGAGAAGGLGFGLAAFLNARLESGFELFARQAQLDQALHQADLVITGEGSLDASTLMGKGVGEIARRARSLNLPCLGLAGSLAADPREAAQAGFTNVRGMVPHLASLEEALAHPAPLLNKLAEQAARDWK